MRAIRSTDDARSGVEVTGPCAARPPEARRWRSRPGRWQIVRSATWVALTVLCLVAVLASTATAATVSAPAAGTGDNYYTDTGIYIPAGESVTLTASGTWSMCQLAVCASGPNGDGFPSSASTWGQFADPSANNGVLIASTDGGGTWTPVGTGPTVVTGPGELLLAANDTPPTNGTCGFNAPTGCYSDNSGAVSVVIAFNNVPTSQDQCKNGGWQSLNDATGARFKNQGECVSYVAAGANSLSAG